MRKNLKTSIFCIVKSIKTIHFTFTTQPFTVVDLRLFKKLAFFNKQTVINQNIYNIANQVKSYSIKHTIAHTKITLKFLKF